MHQIANQASQQASQQASKQAAQQGLAPNNVQTIISHLNAKELITASEEVKHNLWDHKIVTIDKNNITFGNIAIASIVGCIGLLYLNKLRKRFKNFLLDKFHDDIDAANAINNVVSYIVLMIFLTIILQLANVPLSTFAFVGGALAIGVGLGAQNLINNFISSLIIMVERPVKIGDIIEIDNIAGKVIAIGARCITIETYMMRNILIPNSTVLQQNLTNWSLMDSNIKGCVKIRFYKNQLCKIGKEIGNGTIEDYGKLNKTLSSSRELDLTPLQIKEKLENIFDNIEHINHSSKPLIYLKAIDDVYYLYHIDFICDTNKTPDLEKLRSDINLSIAQNFNPNNITVEIS